MVNLMVYQSETYRVHELVRDVTMIGRAPSNHIVIDNPVVSAQHAIVLKVGDFYRRRRSCTRRNSATNCEGLGITRGLNLARCL